MTSTALVGIGLPTHNGESFIAQALESLLGQDHPDLEIVVSDNASTDGTSDIVHELMRRDERLRYERLDRKVSAATNFNRAFALSRGPYFMWAADDDVWDPTYVRRCLAALDDHPAAVMASSRLRFIDPAGDVLAADYDRYDNPDLSSDSVVERARLLLRRGGWYQVYGLARRDALLRTRLFQDVYGPDVVLVLELALMGPIVRVPEALFSYRRFPGRTEADRAGRQGGIPDETRVVSARMTHLEEALSETVRSSALSGPLKLRLLGEIFRAAYIDDTPIRSKARPEAAGRAKSAARERDWARFIKFSLVHQIGQLERLGSRRRSWVSRFRRLPSRARRRLGA
ncbi:MAG TPA: glycosyltransferase [Candidatus Limnocylindrales bacterium]|nr:glycosyltransferase [Candidatus Limnocylindrales bacterium]